MSDRQERSELNLGAIVAALPWLRRAWRVVPGPFRIPLLLIAAVIWVYKKLRNDPIAEGDQVAAG
jgi:hypothetical protein